MERFKKNVAFSEYMNFIKALNLKICTTKKISVAGYLRYLQISSYLKSRDLCTTDNHKKLFNNAKILQKGTVGP